MAGAHILFYSLAKFDTVHDRHHDITDNDVGNSCLCQFPAFFAILGSDYFIDICKRAPDVFPYVGIVLYHQYNGMISVGVSVMVVSSASIGFFSISCWAWIALGYVFSVSRRSVNVVPVSTVLSTFRIPSCNSLKPLTRASPIPEPDA